MECVWMKNSTETRSIALPAESQYLPAPSPLHPSLRQHAALSSSSCSLSSDHHPVVRSNNVYPLVSSTLSTPNTRLSSASTAMTPILTDPMDSHPSTLLHRRPINIPDHKQGLHSVYSIESIPSSLNSTLSIPSSLTSTYSTPSSSSSLNDRQTLLYPPTHSMRPTQGGLVRNRSFEIPRLRDPLYQALHRQLKHDLIDYCEYVIHAMFPYDPSQDHNATKEPNKYMKLSSYIHVIMNRTRMSLTTLATALYYLSKLKMKHPVCKGSQGSSHRLVLAAIVLASKYLYDDTFDNKAWASVSSHLFKTHEVNKMECELLYYLDYKLYVSYEEWIRFTSALEADVRDYMEGYLDRGTRKWSSPLYQSLRCWDLAEEGYHHQHQKRQGHSVKSSAPVNIIPIPGYGVYSS